MKASKLIQILAQGIEDFGDLDVNLISEKPTQEDGNHTYKTIGHHDVFVTEEESSEKKEFFIRF